MTDWGRFKGFRTLPILIVYGHFHSWWMTIFSRFFILWYISREYISREFWRIPRLLLGLYLFLHDEAVKLTLRPEWSSHAHEKHLSLTPKNCVKFFRYDRLLWKFLPLDGSTSWILVLQVQITIVQTVPVIVWITSLFAIHKGFSATIRVIEFCQDELHVGGFWADLVARFV